jgi:hypothetical protein
MDGSTPIDALSIGRFAATAGRAFPHAAALGSGPVDGAQLPHRRICAAGATQRNSLLHGMRFTVAGGRAQPVS